MSRERLIVLLLRFAAAALMLAFFAVFLPTPWMRHMHETVLGMGPFPDSPLVQYLTRSIALLYGFHGVLNLLASFDIHRYRLFVKLSAWVNIVHGVAMLLIDLKSGMPWYWTLGEGPPIGALGVILLVVLRGIPERSA